MSIVQTVKMKGIKPNEYIKYVLELVNKYESRNNEEILLSKFIKISIT